MRPRDTARTQRTLAGRAGPAAFGVGYLASSRMRPNSNGRPRAAAQPRPCPPGRDMSRRMDHRGHLNTSSRSCGLDALLVTLRGHERTNSSRDFGSAFGASRHAIEWDGSSTRCSLRCVLGGQRLAGPDRSRRVYPRGLVARESSRLRRGGKSGRRGLVLICYATMSIRTTLAYPPCSIQQTCRSRKDHAGV